MEFLPFVHPLLAALALLLALLVFRDGFAQRKQRLRRVPAPPGSQARHLKLGPWAAGLICLSAVGGLSSAVLLRKWEPLHTAHGWLGVGSALMFLAMVWLGRRLAARDKRLVELHGVLGLFAVFGAGLAGLLGIALLP